jgi:hypothetical protein
MQDQGRLAMPLPSPHIDRLSWGNMQVSGLGEGKDFKLWPGGGRAWNWIETDTHHVPGILPSDVEELLEHGAEVVVLSRGMLLRLQIARETMALLEDRGVRVRIAETAAAVELYNELAGRNVAVGGLFHSTC